MSADAGGRHGAKSRRKITNKIMSKQGNGKCKRRREVGERRESTRQQLARARGGREGTGHGREAGEPSSWRVGMSFM